jgi:hypothetical protein
MKKKIFLSYVNEDSECLTTIFNWKNQDKKLEVDFNADVLIVDDNNNKTIKTQQEIISLLKPLIDSSNAILILVGNDTHNKTWIEWEYNYAQNKKLKIGLMRVPNSTGSIPPLVPELKIYNLKLKQLKTLIKNWGW